MYPKGQFCKNTVYLERGMPYFTFMDTGAALVKKMNELQMNIRSYLFVKGVYLLERRFDKFSLKMLTIPQKYSIMAMSHELNNRH